MRTYKFINLGLFLTSICMSQLPIDLNPNESYSQTLNIESSGEQLINLTLSSNTSWKQENNESAILTLSINNIYNQDIIIYNGLSEHIYQQSLGYLEAGIYDIDYYFDYDKSSIDASIINIENIELISTNIDSDVLKYSPILYGRNIFSWNESNHTDIPLIMYHDISYDENLKTITYGIIFSNEDSRIGIGLSDMMLSWGRTTDIEWVYQIIIDNNEIVSEIFQGASHIPTSFDGEKLGTHPYLINATANCNFSDTGTSDYLFFLSPIHSIPIGHTKEYLMDQNPWSYKIMGEELFNENKYEEIQDPDHWKMSDVRNYLYIEYEGYQTDSNISTKIITNFYNDCYPYSNNHNAEEIVFNFGNGINRTAIELPENFNPEDLQYITIETSGDDNYSIMLNEIINLFYLSENYQLIDINMGEINQTELNEENPVANFIINQEALTYDCNSILYGTASCDQCNVCSGGNTNLEANQDLDDCHICFGSNEDMDCSGICFGNAYIDNCYICDDNPNNDDETCNAGCYDINAENYDPNATIFDNSCMYSDRIFHVPNEYEKITHAIFFASDLDTILVSPGIYNEEIDFDSKAIVLLSSDGPSLTTIYANSNDNGYGGVYEQGKSVITIRDVTTNQAIIDGFTLENGYGKGVGFEYFISVASEPEMFNDMMYNHISSGGISSINSSIALSNIIIKNNFAENFGAGIGLVDSYSTLENIILEDNHIPDGNALGGGGIAINGGVTSINNCVIRNNSVGLNLYQLNGGGGILCGFNFSEIPLELTLENSEIYNNSANIGAAIGALSGNMLLDRVLIHNNLGEYGSAISLGEPLGLVIDNINMTILQSSIIQNQGAFSVGLIDNSSITMANTILWNEESQHEFMSLPNNSIINSGIYYSDIRILDTLNHIYSFSSNPLFTAPYNLDFNLSSNSPCIDSGINLLTINDETIIDMVLSEYSGIMPDMGYFEHSSSIVNGDVNLDSIINILDIVLMVNIIIDQNTSDIFNLDAADMNQDGIINILDILELINLLLDY